MRHRAPFRAATSAALAMAVASAANAVEFGVELANESEYSDNIRRSADDEQSSWTHEPGVVVDGSHEGIRTTTALSYSAFRRMYEDDIFDDETVLVGTGIFEWRALPDRLTFDVGYDRTETNIDSRLPDDFSNREEVSNATAGAVLTLPGFRSHSLELSYRFDRENAQITSTDRDHHTASAAYVMPLTRTSTLSLVASRSETEFDVEGATDYESRTGSVAYAATRRQTTLSTSAGYTQNKREGLDDASGFSGDIDLTYAFSDTTSLNVGYLHHYDDSSTDFGRGIPDFGDSILDPSVLNEIFLERTAYAGLAFTVAGSAVALSAEHSRVDYEDVERDEKRNTASIDVSRTLRPGMAVSFYSAFSRVEFVDEGTEYDDLRSGVRFEFAPTRRLTLSLDGAYEQREDDTDTFNYDVWTATIGLRYMLYATPGYLAGG